MKLDSIGDWVRTCYSANVTSHMDGEEVTLFGWVQEIRDLGGIRFIILQDKEGTIQLTVPRKKVSPEVALKSDTLQKRYSLSVKDRHHGQNTSKHRSTLRRKSIRPLPRTEHRNIQDSALRYGSDT
jgi:aspartyl/asparaginyl-tRNA synthetase